MKRKDRSKKDRFHLQAFPEAQENLIAQLIRDLPGSPPEEITKRVPDACLAQRLIEALPVEEWVVPLLLALREGFPGKEVQKAVKRSVFKLKQKGVAVETLIPEEKTSPGILRPVQKDPPLCYVGAVYGAGVRSLMLILHRGGQGRDMALAAVSDCKGFLDFLCLSLSKKEAREVKERFEEESGPFVETSPAHAATILEAAYDIHRLDGSSPPAPYIEFRSWFLKDITLLDRPPVVDWAPGPSDASPLLTDQRVGELLDHPLMKSWIIDRDALKPYIQDILKVEESPIYLLGGQKAERIREIGEKCAVELFPAEERERLKRRLEEMAYFFFKLGQEKTASLALAAASVATQEHTSFRPNPVVQALVGRSIDFYTEAMEEFGIERMMGEETKSPIILL